MSFLERWFGEDYKWILFALALGLSMVSVYVLENLYGVYELGLTIPFLNEIARFPDIIYHIVVTPIGLYFLYKGFVKLYRKKRFTTEFLMGVAGLSALYIDYVFEAATVLFLFSIAEYFEEYIEDRARKSVEKLVKYIPNQARVVRDGAEEMIDVDRLSPGVNILVKPGERIPLDGVVIEGLSNVDESLVTGESVPVAKKAGDEVYAGTLNLDGVLYIRVTKHPKDTLVSKIVDLVIEARKNKADTENLVDRFVKYYVPVVILMAVVTASAPPLLFGADFNTWLYRSLILLVVACPSAFIISVPATFFTSITLSSRRGVIIKGGKYIERLGKVDTILLDKTGTLTFGEPRLVLECSESVVEDQDVLVQVASLERYSNHPIAMAFIKWAEESGVDYQKIRVMDVKEVAGKGIIGRVNGSLLAVGNKELVKEIGARLDGKKSGDGHTKVYIIRDGKLVGRVCLADRVRDDALEAVAKLKELGIRSAILTGDKRPVAEKVAAELGVDDYYAELNPVEKLELLRRFKSGAKAVAMVGDGINDAPALAEADVGIAMSDAGVDVTLEAADVVLVKNKLTQIPWLIKLGKKTNIIAWQNIALSLGVKLLLGIMGIMGLIPLWMTVAIGDDGVTLMLFLNILRLGYVK